MVAALALQRGWPGAIPLVWVFNVVGFVDLLNALYQAMTHHPPDVMGPAFFIPTIPVPMLLVSHVLLFWVLLKGNKRE